MLRGLLVLEEKRIESRAGSLLYITNYGTESNGEPKQIKAVLKSKKGLRQRNGQGILFVLPSAQPLDQYIRGTHAPWRQEPARPPTVPHQGLPSAPVCGVSALGGPPFGGPPAFGGGAKGLLFRVVSGLSSSLLFCSCSLK